MSVSKEKEKEKESKAADIDRVGVLAF